MRRRLLPTRLVAIVLAALLGLAGSGAVLAHGVAHAREHRAAGHDGDHHARHHVAHHDDHDGAGAHHADETQVSARLTTSIHGATPPGSHEHPRLDAPPVTRLAVDALLPAVPVLVPVAPLIAATVPAPAAASPLRLADPPTGPPPPSRAPPIG
jgi:hypothetical protein